MTRRVIILFSVLFLLFALLPTIYEMQHRDRLKPIREFELMHNFPTDYNFYLSRIREGLEGRWTVVEKYTSEPHKGSLIQEFYLILGQAGRMVGVVPHDAWRVYLAARIILGLTLLLMIGEYGRRSFGDRKGGKQLTIVAFLLVVTASSWPVIIKEGGGLRLYGYMRWWSVVDPLLRIVFVPHILAGQALIVFLVLAFSHEETIEKSGNWIILGVLGLVLGVVFPPGLIMVYAILLALFVVEMMDKANKTHKTDRTHMTHGAYMMKKKIIPYLVFGFISAPALIYIQMMTRIEPWNRLLVHHALHPTLYKMSEYLLSLGPLLPLGLFGLLVALLRKERSMAPSVAWVVAWAILGIGLSAFPAAMPLRFTQVAPHIPLGVLTAYLFLVLARRVESDTSQRVLSAAYPAGQSSPSRRLFGNIGLLSNVCSFLFTQVSWLGFAGSAGVGGNPRGSHPLSPPNSAKACLPARFCSLIPNTITLIPVFIILLGLGLMYSTYLAQKDFVDHKIRADIPLVPTGTYVMYPLKDFVAALRYLEENTRGAGIVLSETTAGNYIPVASGNTVYVGQDNTVRAEEKWISVRRFFAGAMDQTSAREFMAKNSLSYVFFGPQEKEDGGITDLRKTYQFLEEMYSNERVILYKIK